MSFYKYTTAAYTTRIIILLIDLFLAFLCFHSASILRFNFDLSRTYFILAPVVLLVLFVRLISFRWFRIYAVIVRFAGISDILQIFFAVTGGSIFLVGLAVLLRPYGVTIPFSILLIDYFLMLTVLAAFRLMMPSLYHILFGQKVATSNVIIIGAGQLGAMTRNVVRQDAKSGYKILAILDDNEDLQRKSLDGIPIFRPEELPVLLQEEEIDKAIFAIKEIGIKRKNEIVDLCLEHQVQVLQVPFKSTWISDDFQMEQLKEIQIEDLLDRPVIALDKDNVQRQYKGKTVMITGGAGSIGSEIIRQLIKYSPIEIIIVDQAETPLVNIELECREEFDFSNIIPVITDVNDTPRLVKIFEEHKPQVIFHAAAYKHVPIMEAYPREAIQANVNGTKTMAMLAEAYEVDKFVMVSTDKAVNPTNVMGASKRIAEIFIQSFNNTSTTKFITTRFGNVLGSNGSVVPRFKKQIAKGGPLTVTHKDITRYFMTIPEASQLVLEAGAMGEGGEIFLFDMGEPVKIADLAGKMIQLSGLTPDVDIEIKYTGLRPGEKLYEELLSTKENSIETHHPKITKAKVRQYEFIRIERSINELIASLDSENDMKLVARMKALIPEYQSENSRFNDLDVDNASKSTDPTKEIPSDVG